MTATPVRSRSPLLRLHDEHRDPRPRRRDMWPTPKPRSTTRVEASGAMDDQPKGEEYGCAAGLPEFRDQPSAQTTPGEAMRIRSRLVAHVATVLVAGALVAPPAQAQDTTPPQLTGFSMSPTSINATGLSTVPVTFTAQLVDSTGVGGACDPVAAPLPKVVIERPNDSLRLYPRDIYLQRTAGTDQNGTWSATLNMSAGLAGTWTAVSVVAEDTACNQGATDPGTLGGPTTLTVSGQHAPHLSMGFRPNPVDSRYPYAVRGRAYYMDTGAPIPRLRVCLAWRWMCNAVADPTVWKFATTDANGYYEVRVDPSVDETQFWLNYLSASLYSPRTGEPDKLEGVVHSMRASGVPWRPTVVAAATTPRIQLGEDAIVEGKVFGLVVGFSRAVHLQQLGRTAWKTVATGWVRASGRYTLTTRPPVRGTHTYRAVSVPGANALNGYSGSVHMEVN
jgi:hypothetical protein